VSPFEFHNGELHVENISIREISSSVDTPFYCYSNLSMENRYGEFASAFSSINSSILFSIKSNSNISVIKTFAKLGAGADVVSEGEIKRAITAGIQGSDIVFSGVGKTQNELSGALEIGVSQFNVESENELIALNEVAKSQGTKAPVALRVNPDVDADSHDKISTGRHGDKFGIPIKDARAIYAKASKMPGIEITGLAVHIGSQILSLAPFTLAFREVSKLVGLLTSDGHGIKNLDLGGGLGISYGPETPLNPKDYAKAVISETAETNCHIFLEPGRFLVGDAGIIVTQVLYTKHGDGRQMVIIDCGMNDLLRPAMYDARHEIVPIKTANNEPLAPADVVGPVCESGDTFAHGISLPSLHPGDLLAIKTAGAYGAVMASTYNSRPLIPEVLVKGNSYSVVRPRQSYEDLIGSEIIAPWLT